jgi:quercetin dioxygenase-like cupin family protein
MSKSIGALLCLFVLSAISSAYADDATKPEIRRTPVLKSTTTITGQKLEYPNTNNAEFTMYTAELPPGAETAWHTHPYPGYLYVISGTLTLEFEGGKQLQFSAGQGFVESLNTLHHTRNLTKEPVKVLVAFTGVEGKPVLINKAP